MTTATRTSPNIRLMGGNNSCACTCVTNLCTFLCSPLQTNREFKKTTTATAAATPLNKGTFPCCPLQNKNVNSPSSALSGEREPRFIDVFWIQFRDSFDRDKESK